MADRLKTLLSLISPCKQFADVGCDHGYMAKAVLDGGLCESAIITDISEKCLNKARSLLKSYIDNGVVNSIVTDGLKSVPYCDQVLIAGMGGEEIVKIIINSPFLPEKFVLQPMKNTKKVRLCLLDMGYRIDKDFVFYSGRKYYDTIVAVKGTDKLTDEELEFGKTNLQEKSPDFIRRLTEERNKLLSLIESNNLSQKDEQNFKKEIEKIERYL